MKTLRRLRQAIALSAVVGVIAIGTACGGSPAARPATAAQPGTPTPAATAHADHAAEIDQLNMTFIPAKVSVKLGQTVLIKNSETTIHTANINGKNITGNMKKGDSTPWTAKAAGEYKVSCDYHPQMFATISVS